MILYISHNKIDINRSYMKVRNGRESWLKSRDAPGSRANSRGPCAGRCGAPGACARSTSATRRRAGRRRFLATAARGSRPRGVLLGFWTRNGEENESFSMEIRGFPGLNARFIVVSCRSSGLKAPSGPPETSPLPAKSRFVPKNSLKQEILDVQS